MRSCRYRPTACLASAPCSFLARYAVEKYVVGKPFLTHYFLENCTRFCPYLPLVSTALLVSAGPPSLVSSILLIPQFPSSCLPAGTPVTCRVGLHCARIWVALVHL